MIGKLGVGAVTWAVLTWVATASVLRAQEPAASYADPGVATTFRWGLQRTDLVRYNRIESLSIGARGQARARGFAGPLTLNAIVRMGAADLVPNLRGEVVRETIESRWTLSAYHELAAVDGRVRALRVGNSLAALLLGRDDGEYYRRSGISLEWTPPSAQRSSFSVRAYRERHRAVSREARFALVHATSHSWTFRPNVQADAGDETGLVVRAGDRHTAAFDDALVSTGVGLSLVDGLIRFDLGRGLRAPEGWRVDLYLDGIL